MRSQPRTSGKRHVLRWVAVAAVVIVAAGTLGVYLKYRAVYDSITRVTVPSTALGHRPPAYSTTAQNILGYVKVGADATSFEITHYSTSPASSMFQLPPGATVTTVTIPSSTTTTTS